MPTERVESAAGGSESPVEIEMVSAEMHLVTHVYRFLIQSDLKGERDVTRLRIDDSGGADPQTAQLLRSAIESKLARIRLGIAATEARLQAFERRYRMDSAEGVAKLTAEDLAGGDLDYVEWLGEWRLLQHLKDDLRRLEAIEYADR